MSRKLFGTLRRNFSTIGWPQPEHVITDAEEEEEEAEEEAMESKLEDDDDDDNDDDDADADSLVAMWTLPFMCFSWS